MTRVGWIFSLVRSGSSAAAYGCAAPWGLAVADEPFGPWIRTSPPHSMPKRQAQLVKAYRAMGHTLNADVVGLANELFAELGQRDPTGKGRVVCKCPHLLFTPEDFAAWFEAPVGRHGEDTVTHRAAYLIRNPLRRLNSAYGRGWEHVLNDPFELEVFRTFSERWRRAETRLTYDRLRREPEAFFSSLFKGLGFGGGDGDARKAAAYIASTYHESSGQIGDADPSRPRSERVWSAPSEVLDVYLNDEQIRQFMAEQGWPTSRRGYETGRLGRLWSTLTAS